MNILALSPHTDDAEVVGAEYAEAFEVLRWVE